MCLLHLHRRLPDVPRCVRARPRPPAFICPCTSRTSTRRRCGCGSEAYSGTTCPSVRRSSWKCPWGMCCPVQKERSVIRHIPMHVHIPRGSHMVGSFAILHVVLHCPFILQQSQGRVMICWAVGHCILYMHSHAGRSGVGVVQLRLAAIL
jgi:hypothetical protein